ncbi:hypothetical protein BC943DRAFT_316832 [Umbelopsis sp. AD052]|nr:hypothetical protein BC943DRAFT_316832 [Umbelopsis sp. AD052]
MVKDILGTVISRSLYRCLLLIRFIIIFFINLQKLFEYSRHIYPVLSYSHAVTRRSLLLYTAKRSSLNPMKCILATYVFSVLSHSTCHFFLWLAITRT